MKENRQYKIILAGDDGVGKTAFAQKHLTGVFEQRYIATRGVKVYPVTIETENPIIFNVWDTAGQEKLGGLPTEYYINADAAIVMFDLTGANTFKNLQFWINGIRKVCQAAPVVIVGTKSDIKNGRKVPPSYTDLIIKRFDCIAYHEISTKTGENCDDAFLTIAQYLGNDGRSNANL